MRMGMNIKILVFGMISLLIVISLCGCSTVYEKPKLDITINDVFYSQAKCECNEGKVVYLNITFTNKDDKELHHIHPLLIYTDTGEEKLVTSQEHFEVIPIGESVTITVYTRDTDYDCGCINWDEKPVTFVYRYGSGEMFAPASAEVEIPKALINE